MTHNILLAKRKKGWLKFYSPRMESQKIQTIAAMCRKRREGWHQRCFFWYDQVCCIYPSFVERYTVQAFSITSDPDPKLIPEEQDQITITKRLNCHTISSSALSKSSFWLWLRSWETPFPRRINIVYNVTNVKQHKLFGVNASRPLPDVTPKRTNPLAVVKCVLSRFFHSSAAAGSIRYVWQARFESPIAKGQRIPSEPLTERELRVVQEARIWCPIPLRVNLLHRPTESLHELIWSDTHH